MQVERGDRSQRGTLFGQAPNGEFSAGHLCELRRMGTDQLDILLVVVLPMDYDRRFGCVLAAR